jgi:iron uptake system component EfeO
MPRLLTAVGAVSVCAVLLGTLAACSDDGSDVRSDPTRSAGGGSGSLNEQDLGGPAKTRQLQAAVDSYRTYVLAEVTKIRTATTKFTDAVRAGDVAAAQELYAPSRFSWEGIEPIAGLVPNIDAVVDSRVDDFTGPDDPKFTGWHRLEYLLWVKKSTAGAAPLADRLDADLARLETEIKKVAITPKAMALGAGDLVEEVSKGKITGEEDRYSHTDLWDFAGNIEGAQAVFRAITPVLKAKDNVLYNTLLRGFGAVTASLTKYRTPSGAYKPYNELRADDKSAMQAQLATLSEDLSKVVAALDL